MDQSISGDLRSQTFELSVPREIQYQYTYVVEAEEGCFLPTLSNSPFLLPSSTPFLHHIATRLTPPPFPSSPSSTPFSLVPSHSHTPHFILPIASPSPYLLCISSHSELYRCDLSGSDCERCSSGTGSHGDARN